MKIRRTFATAFVLVWTSCPTLFALERGKQIGKREVARLVRTSPSLLSQLGAMNVGEVTIEDNTITLTRPEATYVFDRATLTFEQGVASGLATIYDSQSGEVAEMIISKVAAVGDNRIDYSVTTSILDEQRTESGTMIGIAEGRVLAITSVNGEDIESSLISFEKPVVVDSSVASTPVMITAVSMTHTSPDLGGVAGFWIGALFVIFGIVLFVAVTCFAFGWFGCDGSFWWGSGDR